MLIFFKVSINNCIYRVASSYDGFFKKPKLSNNNNKNLLFIHTLLNLNRNSKVRAVSNFKPE